MKLYNSLGPNPRLVRMFLLEKGLEIPFQEVDILGGENRGDDFKKLNPAGQMPALELDDGSVLSETIAICEYLEERQPQPALIGATPEERARTRMWQRRCELNITEPAANGFRYAEGLAMFKERIPVIPEAADGLKRVAQHGLRWLDDQIAGRDFVAGDRLSVADIQLYCFLDFAATVGQSRDESLENVDAWFRRVNERPSAEASLHPAAKAGGMRA